MVDHHSRLDRLELQPVSQRRESIAFQIPILSLLDPDEHHSLEVLNNHILLQASNRGRLQSLNISLLSELPDQFLLMSVLFPRLHDSVQPVKVDNGTGFPLPLPLVELRKHPVQIVLLAKQKHLIVIDLEQFALEGELMESGEGTA